MINVNSWHTWPRRQLLSNNLTEEKKEKRIRTNIRIKKYIVAIEQVLCLITLVSSTTEYI
jgi:hypothetical protein